MKKFKNTCALLPINTCVFIELRFRFFQKQLPIYLTSNIKLLINNKRYLKNNFRRDDCYELALIVHKSGGGGGGQL